jgi:uncharacterized phage protein (TIGR02220 family)
VKIKPKKWEEFQHYKDIHYAKGAKPAWVKLHSKLLDDFEYQSMPVASRALAPMLWLIASEDPNGVIDANPEKLAFRLRWTGSEVSEALSPLIGKGFFEVVQFPQGETRPSLEPVYIESRSEKKREEERREETPIVPLARDGARLAKRNLKSEAVHLLEFLNGRAGRHFRPVPATLKFIEARLAEGVTVQDLKTLIARKCRDWLGTDMEKFLRPETLFNATKCQSYLGEIPPEVSCNANPVTAPSPPEPESAPADGRSPSPKSASTQSPTGSTEPARGSPPADAAAFLVH